MSKNKLELKIIDNFFSQNELNILTNNLTRIPYTPLRDHYGKGNHFGMIHDFKKNTTNQWLFDKIKKNFFPNMNLIDVESRFTVRHNKSKVLAHVDDNDYNFIAYLKGKELVYNGTGFYHNKNLNTYVGFVENRAIFFDGLNNHHTDLQALGESSMRYTLNIFYDKRRNTDEK